MEEILNRYKKHRACEVPEGYFDSLPDQVLSRIDEDSVRVSAGDSDEVAAGSHHSESDFPVPDGYFDTLPDAVLSRISKEDGEMMGLLETHRNNDGYPVPDGYFESLPQKVSQRIAAEASQRPLFLRRRIVRIAAVAACSGLLMGTGFYLLNMLNSPANLSSDKVVHTNPAPSAENNPRETLDMDKSFAHVAETQESLSAKKTAVPVSSAGIATDAATDRFIEENLFEDEMDEMDYEILDFYSDDMAVSDMWGI